jgi:hypothetical protein
MEYPMKKNILNYILMILLLFAAGCSGQVFKTLVEGGADTVGPTVVSVTSTAIDSIRVEFSEEVDPATAGDVGNYDIPGLATFDAATTTNARVIRLSTDYQYFTIYDIIVSANVLDLNDNPMEADYNGTFQGAVEEPRIANVDAIKTDQVLLEFSEQVSGPAGDTASYVIYPSLTISSVTFPYGDATFALLDLSNEMQDTNYTLEITGAIQDLAGYDMHPLYSEQSFPGDARPRVSTINSASVNSIRLKYTEEVDQTSAEIPGSYTITQITGAGAGSTLTIASITIDSSDPSIVLIDHTPDVQAQESYQVVISGVEDLNGNTVAPGTSGYFMGNGPPAVASAAAAGPNGVLVTFSEPLRSSDDTAAIDPLNYSISGLTVTGASWPSGSPGDRTRVELTTSTQQQQIYTVVLAADVLHAADDDTAIAAGYNSSSFQGDGLPSVVTAVALDPTHVKVIFSEPVDLTTGQNISNYAITSVGYPSLSITGAARQPDPNTNEVILTTSSQLYVNYTVTATGVLDSTGNSISGNNTANFAGIGTDNTPPDIITVVSNSDTQIRVYFNESVDETSAETSSNYTASNMSTATLSVTGTLGTADAGTLTISVSDSSTGSDAIIVTSGSAENLPGGVFNQTASSEKLVAYSIVSAINADWQSPVRAYAHGATIELVSRTFGSDGDLTVDNTGISNLSVDSVVASSSAAPSSAVRSDGNYALVDLTFGTSLSGIYELTVQNVADTTLPPNYMSSPVTTPVVVRGSDEAPPVVKGAYAPDSTHIRLLFDEPVDALTASKVSNFYIERDTATFDLSSGTASGDSLLLTYDGGSTYSMTAANNEDIASNIWARSAQAENSAVNIARVMNQSSTSPVYAHAIGTTIYLTRRTPQSGTIDSLAPTGFTGTFDHSTPANYTNNRTIGAAARNEAFPFEVLLTLSTLTPLETDHDYGITATDIADVVINPVTGKVNIGHGGTRAEIPLSSENTAPAADTDAPEIVSATALSDSLVQLIFNESVEQISAENPLNYFISPTLSVTSAVRDSSNNNVVLLYTELQGALTYYLTVNGVSDLSGNVTSGQSASFTGMASVNVGNGPVGNSVNGVGNVNNLSIIAAIEYNGKLYVSTMNKASGEFQTEIYASDASGVYFTQVNYSGFSPPTDYIKQQKTTSLEILGGLLWASTSETPSEKLNVYYTDGTGTPHSWTWDTPTLTNLGNNGYTMLLNYGITSPRLYVIHAGNLSYRSGPDAYVAVASSGDFGVTNGSEFMRMIAFGGRMYVGVSTPTGMRVYRSKGVNADAPIGFSDFEKVLDADDTALIGMNGYDADNPVDLLDGVPVDVSEPHYADVYNSAVVSMAVYNGYIYIGTKNDHGAQIWRSQDGLTWERVLDFGTGAAFAGKDDTNNTQISSLQVNSSFIYAGTRNATTGGEVWRSPDGVAWEQFGSDGFGSASYTDIPAMAVFNGLIYFCMEDQTSGGAVFRSSN